MSFPQMIIDVAELLICASLISTIVVGYTITFSWIASIKLLVGSLTFTLVKSTRAKIYRQLVAKSIRQNLAMIVKTTNDDVTNTFNHTTLHTVDSHKIKTLAQHGLNNSDVIMYSIDTTVLDGQHFNWISAYHYLADLMVQPIINSYATKSLDFNQTQIDRTVKVLQSVIDTKTRLSRL